MSHPDESDAGTEARPDTAPSARRLHLETVAWRRIQVSLSVRAADGRPLAGTTFRLRDTGRPGVVMAPTNAMIDGTVAELRFNVMQGPGQEPLEPGRWILEIARADGAATARPAVIVAPHAECGQASATFDLGRGRYVVRPGVHPTSGLFALEVSLDETATPAWAVSDVRSPLARLMLRLRRLRPGTFAVLFRLLRAMSRRNGRRILFSSDSRDRLGGNLKIVYDRMVDLGLDREYRLETLFKPSITTSRSARDRLRLPWLLARSDVIVIDDFQPVIYRVDDPEMRIVQLWHAWGAFKTVGYSRVGKPGGVSPYSRVHKNYSFAAVSSTSEVPFYAEAFGIPEWRVIPTGIPRMDQFFDPLRRAASREAALTAIPAARGRMTILFAPTFRGHGARTAWYDLERIDYRALHLLCVEKDALCIIRMHPFVRTPLSIPEAYADRIIDGSGVSIDINELLFAVDLLITDYSSVVFEFSTMDRPMLFYAYDLEAYVASRDFYVDYVDFVPGRIVRTFAELLDAIRREDYDVARLKAFRARHLDHFDGHATDRVIDLILGR